MKSYILCALLACSASVAIAKVEIAGNNNQSTTIKNSGIANSAVGVGSESVLNANSVEGNVKIGGNNKQTLSIENSGLANSSVGAMSKAKLNIGSVSGK
ncbi:MULTISPECIES: hypothetical protein [unclassified Paraburkholderia]|uniref:hypothetical protein n=1 Tax=unclassified Paraburkholderia TaxID=2615204 RepID=UPI00161DA16A|nr:MULTISPECIES: hypothetical protein [unclassified Paraburkholderia]MBB5407450.1 hypothetical protein [Paraburkholderia sp. HC6.4b]MBB5453794.1 hypothetical protein [Paraburkholderia sp. Kb1A]MBB5496617.1 hypothetical protein [Paraburkholderia sp. MM5384-R2]